MKFKFFPHTADVEFEAYGKNMEQAFENSALAMFEVMTNTKRIKPKIRKSIKIKSEDLESLLYDFLEKLLIFHDSENLMFSKFKIKKIGKKNGNYALESDVWGEEFNIKKHENRVLVKAATYNSMKIGRKNKKYFVHAVLDI